MFYVKFMHLHSHLFRRYLWVTGVGFKVCRELQMTSFVEVEGSQGPAWSAVPWVALSVTSQRRGTVFTVCTKVWVSPGRSSSAGSHSPYV